MEITLCTQTLMTLLCVEWDVEHILTHSLTHSHRPEQCLAAYVGVMVKIQLLNKVQMIYTDRYLYYIHRSDIGLNTFCNHRKQKQVNLELAKHGKV